MDQDLTLRPMTGEDVPFAIKIIEAIDEDDAEAATESYNGGDLADQYVLSKDGQIIGVSGYRRAMGTHMTGWISWTYISPEYQGKGYGQQMLNELLDIMRANKCRKVFVATSDYQDETTGPVYEVAQHVYKKAGFELEITHENYYEPGESQLIYGLALTEIDSDRQIQVDDTCVFFNGLNEVEETDDVYVINWEVKKQKLFKPSSQFTAEDLEIGIKTAKEWGARSIFISFPSNMSSVEQPLAAAGFVEAGRLKDYYEDGLDEIHYRFDL